MDLSFLVGAVSLWWWIISYIIVWGRELSILFVRDDNGYQCIVYYSMIWFVDEGWPQRVVGWWLVLVSVWRSIESVANVSTSSMFRLCSIIYIITFLRDLNSVFRVLRNTVAMIKIYSWVSESLRTHWIYIDRFIGLIKRRRWWYVSLLSMRSECKSVNFVIHR